MTNFIRTNLGEYINISEIRGIYVDDEHTVVARFKAENYLMYMMRNLCGN